MQRTFFSEQGFIGCLGMIEDHVNDSKKYYVKLQRNKNELLRQRMPYESTNSIVLGCCCSFHKLNREEVIN